MAATGGARRDHAESIQQVYKLVLGSNSLGRLDVFAGMACSTTRIRTYRFIGSYYM